MFQGHHYNWFWTLPAVLDNSNDFEQYSHFGATFPAFMVHGTDVRHFIRHFQGSPHLNRDKIEYNLSVPGIQGRCHENALIKPDPEVGLALKGL